MKYEFVSDGYAEQLHELASDLVTPERFNPREMPKDEIRLAYMTPEQFMEFMGKVAMEEHDA